MSTLILTLTLILGPNYLNLQLDASWVPPSRIWGRFIVFVDDVDDVYNRLISAGYKPAMSPTNAIWGERYFHITDPSGHEISLARRTTSNVKDC
jgi:predicted enzyme related to lactoylglutathione lyase